MAPTRELAASGRRRKLAALALTLAAVGLPVNTLASYVPLLIAAVAIFSGEDTGAPGGQRAGARTHKLRARYCLRCVVRQKDLRSLA